MVRKEAEIVQQILRPIRESLRMSMVKNDSNMMLHSLVTSMWSMLHTIAFHSFSLSCREAPEMVEPSTKDKPRPSPENSSTHNHGDSQIDPVMLKYSRPCDPGNCKAEKTRTAAAKGM